MEPERAERVRETWDRCRHQALHAFAYRQMTAYRAELCAPLAPIQSYPYGKSVTSAEAERVVLVFVHEVRTRDHPLAPQPWRVVCEGLVLETGVYEP